MLNAWHDNVFSTLMCKHDNSKAIKLASNLITLTEKEKRAWPPIYIASLSAEEITFT